MFIVFFVHFKNTSFCAVLQFSLQTVINNLVCKEIQYSDKVYRENRVSNFTKLFNYEVTK